MRTKTFSAKRLLSLLLTVAMFATMILPTSVFAITPVTASATVAEVSEGVQAKTITVTFIEEMKLADDAVPDVDIKVLDKTFGTGASAVLDSTGKVMTITLGTGATVVATEIMTFPTNKFEYVDNSGTYFNDDVVIDGSLECATIDYSGIVPAGATITVDGYTAAPTSVGTGTFNYTLTKDGYIKKTGSFTIDQSLLGTTYTVTDSMTEKVSYVELDIAISAAEALNPASYTDASFAAVTSALNDAKAIDRNLENNATNEAMIEDAIEALDDAIAALVEIKEVTFTAVAVADEATVDYAKANKIVLVFSEPVADGADVLSKLNIKDEISAAAWSNDNTIYTLTLKATHGLDDDAIIEFVNDDQSILTKLGNAMADTDATVVGNIDEAYESVTATKMAATIVKSSAKPGVVAGDKIVLVFNAPVYQKPATITVNGMTANVVADTANTVYEIILAGTESISDSTELTYGSITNVPLDGTFGTAVAPKALVAVAVDKDGTAKKTNDEIVVVFDRPTNGSEDISALSVFSDADWNDANTELTLKVAGETGINSTIDISAMGIKDEYDMVAATSTSSLTLLGSFGTVTAPAVLSMTAVDIDGTAKTAGDLVVIVFDRPTNHSTDISELTDFVDANWEANDTKLILTVGAGALIKNGDSLDISSMDIMDKDSIVAATNTEMTLAGSFGTVTAPVALRAYAVDNDGTELVYNKIDGTVYKDQIVVVFDTPTNKANDISKISIVGTGYTATLGTEAELDWEEDGTKLVITLGKDTVIKNDATIDLTNLGIMDRDNIVAAASTSLKLDIEGSFGYTTKPRITKAVAFTQGELDYIRIFFNTQVKVVAEVGVTTGFSMTNITREGLNTSVPGLTYYEFVMPKDGHGEFTSKQYTIALSGIVDYDTGSIALDTTPVDIIGGFVSPITPELLSVTAISESGSGIAKAGDKIVAVFNTEVTLGSISIEGVTSGQYEIPAYAKDANGNDIKNVIEITLKENDLPITTGTTEITFDNFFDNATNSAEMTRTTKKIGGSFGNLIVPEILSVTAISQDGSGVEKVDDSIVVVFNTKVDVDGNNGVFVYTYKLKASDFAPETGCRYAVGKTFNVTVKSSSTGREYTLSEIIGGSYGFMQTVSVKSVTLSEDEGYETITVVFDGETNQVGIDKDKLFNNNFFMNGTDKVFFLGTIKSANWVNATTLKIKLENPTLTDSLTLNLDELGIKDEATQTEITGLEALEVKGYIVPVVETVTAADGKITIRFSSRTNGVANISNFTSLFGVGATTAWSDYNRTLTITLGENYTIRNNGYVVLNGMGITDGFTGEHSIIGEYRVVGDIASNKVAVVSVKAQSTNKAIETAHKGDTIVIKFNSATDLKGFALNTPIAAADVDTFISVEGGNEAAFGTGYTGIWTAYDRFVINLGGSSTEGEGDSAVTTGVDPAIAIDNIITIKDVKFADGTGEMDDAPVKLAGSFDGREFLITNIGNITTVGADCRVKASVEYIYGEKTPTIVCVAYKGTTVAGIMRMTLSINDKVEPVFEFANGADITSAKIFVFDDAFSDITASPEVLAKTIEIIK